MKEHLDGSVDDEFQSVRDLFRLNFTEGWERGGAAFAVYHHGKLVVDIWGGYADETCNRRWNDDTITALFSCTKSVTAICMAMLVDRGLCDYGDKVTRFWSEFGQHGKQDITIDMILAHRAGLPYFDHTMTLADLTDDHRLSTIIEQEKLKYEPGTKTAYHTLTFGWLVDQIFCRIDPQHRTVGQFFREEIAEKHHVDIHIGDCLSEEYRIARLSDINIPLAIREFFYDRKLIVMGKTVLSPCGYFTKGMRNMREFGKDFSLFNNPETRYAGQPAVNGVGSARGLALVHQLAFDGTLLSNEMQEKISKPILVNEYDHTIGEAQNKGHGFIYTRSPMGSWQIGHMGIGGQTVRFDRENDMALCYLTNALKAGSGEHVYTYNRLEKKVYEIITK